MAVNLTERLREHPAKRFAAPVRVIDLEQSFDALLAEPHDGTDGHRQITIVHDNALTLVLFHFERDGSFPKHDVEGEVTLHVLDGELEVETARQTDALGAGQIIVIGSGNTFSLRATQAARMLMTVRLSREELREGL